MLKYTLIQLNYEGKIVFLCLTLNQINLNFIWNNMASLP